jgi:flagellar basal-body rod protein FlgB
MDLIRNDLATQALSKALDGLSLRAQTIANNVANVDTPNFKSSEVAFEQDLQAALSRRSDGLPLATTNARHLSDGSSLTLDAVQPRAVPLLSTSMRNDGNNVDIDRQMAQLAETQLSFQAATQLLNTKFQQLKLAIWEGKK